MILSVDILYIPSNLAHLRALGIHHHLRFQRKLEETAAGKLTCGFPAHPWLFH